MNSYVVVYALLEYIVAQGVQCEGTKWPLFIDKLQV